MAENFTNFVLKLAQDPQTLAQFQKQPDVIMKQAGLSPAEQTVLLSNDPALIRNALAADTSGSAELAATTIVITAVYVHVIHHGTEEEKKTSGDLSS